MMLACSLLPFFWRVQPSSPKESPTPPSLEALAAIAGIVEASAQGERGSTWRLSQASWVTVWGAGAFGIAGLVEDPAPYRFRVPPDAGMRIVGGHRPFSVESYRNGMPLFGVRRGEEGDPARPLGFRYGRDGLCTNVTILVFEKGKWRKPRLSRRETTIMGRFMAANEYAGGSEGPPPATFGAPWIRIVARGYGDYWIDRDLDCVGPFGTGGRLLDIRSDIEDLIAGGYSRAALSKAKGG